MKNDFKWLYPLGVMSKRIQEYAWNTTNVGTPDTWSSTLKSAINMCLASDYPAYVWWGEELTVFYNDAYIALAGSKKHAFSLGRPAKEMWPEIWPILEGFISEVKTTLSPVWRENMFMPLERNGSKEEAYFSFSFNPLLNDEGIFSGVNCICSEMTEIQESRNRLELALKGGNMGTWSIDLSNNTFLGDDRFSEIHGIPSSRHDVQETLAKRFHPDDSEATGKNLSDAIQNNGVYSAEYRIIQPDGSYRWIYSRGEVQKNSSGKPITMSGVSLDIHDKKIIEEELRQAVEDRDEFLSIASHELKTPLTSLKLLSQSYTRLINKQNPDAYSPARVKDYVAQSNRQVVRLARLVDEMLDVSRIRSQRMNIARNPFDLCVLISETLTFLQDQFHSAKYQLPVLETDCQSLEVVWDRMRIEQVLINLLTNAIRYGNLRPIAIKLLIRGQTVRIEVIDQGIGVSDPAKKIIFNRFERDIHADEVSGLGLGLFISKQIVEAHNGEIWVEDNAPQGSRFIVELPISH